ncbi:MAG: YlxR family protein [Deltaproteobacteria bacterium]|nr:YlxR family protein [Deltaproteobacteria bacterium]
MVSKRGHIPIRTCISCGKRQSKIDLLRIVLNDKGYVVRDIDMKAEGRGAYVCTDISCLERLKIGNRLKRAFKREVFMEKEF